MFCRLTQLESGRWHCPVCDPAAVRSLPVAAARRHCRPEGTRPRTAAELAAQALEAELRQARASGAVGLPPEQVQARLAVCRNCGNFRGAGCGLFAARYSACRAWFWALVESPRQSVDPCPEWPQAATPSVSNQP